MIVFVHSLLKAMGQPSRTAGLLPIVIENSYMKTLSNEVVLTHRWDVHRRSLESDAVARDEAKELAGAEYCSSDVLLRLSFLVSEDAPSEFDLRWFILCFCLK